MEIRYLSSVRSESGFGNSLTRAVSAKPESHGTSVRSPPSGISTVVKTTSEENGHSMGNINGTSDIVVARVTGFLCWSLCKERHLLTSEELASYMLDLEYFL
jgi:hypothetical protein